MGAKSKSTHKKKKISKHVLKARETAAGQQAVNATTSASSPADTSGTVVGKRKQKKNRHNKDPSDVAAYLEEWKASQTGKSGWKFNKNTQSWLIRHMYEADKTPKGVFTLLLEYLGGLEGKTTRQWIRAEASRRALRYKSFEKESDGKASGSAGVKDEDAMKGDGKASDEKSLSEDQQEEEARWKKLSEHDKRKEYKRARKVLETIKE